jgi:dienelactone hydrolase
MLVGFDAGRLGLATLLALGLILFSANTLTLLDPSRDSYPTPPPLGLDTYKQLWGFDWSSNLSLTLHGTRTTSWRGERVEVLHYTFQLRPDTPGCLVHAWLYRRPGTLPSSPWVILVHGLGGNHTFYERGEAPLAPRLASAGLNVLAIDAAGHGESCIPGGRSWRDLAGDLRPGRLFLYYVYLSGVRAVEAALALGAEPGRVAVGGVSMGGMTSLVVGSIHPAVTLAVPVVASGCVTCMIASGGLANLVGAPNQPLDAQAAVWLSASDPLSYTRLAAERGLLGGKEFYILYSGHDEYFPLEGLYPTVEALESGGARVVVALDPNNDHYRAAPGWVDSVVRVVESWARGSDPLRGLPEARPAGLKPLLYGGSGWWRPAADGPGYAPLTPLLPAILGGEVVARLHPEPPLATSLPSQEPAAIRLLLALLGAALAWYAGRRLLGSWGWAPLLATLASVAAFAAPFWWWPGRFALGITGFMERYGVTPSLAAGVPSLGLGTAALAAAPLAAGFLACLRGSRRSRLAGAAVYLALALPPYLLARMVLAAIASRAPWPLPAHVIPVEAAHALVAAIAWLLASKAPLPERVRGWRLTG